MLDRRPRLLFLSQTLPYPPDGGVKIRTFHVLRLLSRAFDTTALCFYRRGLVRDEGAIGTAVEALGQFARVETFKIPQEHSAPRLVWDHLRSVATRRAYTAFAYQSTAFANRLRHHLQTTPFDVVHADSLDLAGYFPMLGQLPLVCVHHDAQSVLLGRRALHERSRARRLYVRHQAALMHAEEARWCPRVSLNVTVSGQDAEALRKIAPTAEFTVVPNGVDLAAFRPAPVAEEGIAFVGGSTWFPNLDAMHYFCSTILPLVREKQPEAKVTWIGRASEDQREDFMREYGISVVGYVDDVIPYLQRAACFIAPIRVGGGTRIKILDAWATGKAVVSTTIGCEGLTATDGVNILIRDDPAAFAEAICSVLTNPDLREKLGAAGRATVEADYSWDAIGTAMNRVYLEVAATRAGATV